MPQLFFATKLKSPNFAATGTLFYRIILIYIITQNFKFLSNYEKFFDRSFMIYLF